MIQYGMVLTKKRIKLKDAKTGFISNNAREMDPELICSDFIKKNIKKWEKRMKHNAPIIKKNQINGILTNIINSISENPTAKSWVISGSYYPYDKETIDVLKSRGFLVRQHLEKTGHGCLVNPVPEIYLK